MLIVLVVSMPGVQQHRALRRVHPQCSDPSFISPPWHLSRATSTTAIKGGTTSMATKSHGTGGQPSVHPSLKRYKYGYADSTLPTINVIILKKTKTQNRHYGVTVVLFNAKQSFLPPPNGQETKTKHKNATADMNYLFLVFRRRACK